MYVCGFCKQPSKPREHRTMIPVEVRPKTYVNTKLVLGETQYDDTYVEVTSRGTEIVKEVAACPRCVERENDQLLPVMH